MALQRDPRLAQFAERLLHQVQAYYTLKARCFYLNPDNSLDAKTIKASVKYSLHVPKACYRDSSLPRYKQ